MNLFSIVQAQIRNNAISSNLSDLEGTEFLQKTIAAMVATSFVIGGLIFVFMLIMGGIKYITSEGDKAQAETARKTITHALIGIVILFALYAILRTVGCFFGLNFLSISIGEMNVSFGECQTPNGASGPGAPPGP